MFSYNRAAKINGGGFDGKVDEVRLSSVARSADWIATEYNNQSSASTFYQVVDQAQTAFITFF